MGAPGLLSARAKLDAVPEWTRWLDELGATLSTARDSTHATTLLTEIRAKWADDEGVASAVYRTGLQAHMGGQLMVREVEVPEASGRRKLSVTDAPAFFSLPFREALEAFLERRLVSPDEWAGLSDAQRLRAFAATRLAGEQVTGRARQLLEDHLREGGSIDGFVRSLRDEELSLGIEPSTPWYAELIARNGVQLAYGQGRLQQLEAEPVVQARPYVQYRTAGDARVRWAHAELNGKVFNRRDDPGWRRFAPPLGHQCRCALVTVRDPGSVTDSSDLESRGLGPDPGWSGPGSTFGHLI